MKISLQDYPIEIKIGHYPDERKIKTRILLSFYITLKKHNKQNHDNLNNTLDYEVFLKEVNKYISCGLGATHLLESLITKLGHHIIKKYKKIEQLTINAEKVAITAYAWGRGAKISLEETFIYKES